MIRIESLSKSYGKLQVLKSISLNVGKGKITGVVGPNGCGKTTLIKSILGLVVPDSGKIIVDEKNILGTWSYRSQIGYMPQNPEFPHNLSINELLNFVEDVREEKAIDKNKYYEIFQLNEHVKKQFGVLSGGTKQKVAAVCALMFKPKILILDEPTVGLDPVSANRFKDIVRDCAKEGTSVLMVSHIMSEMEQLVDNMLFLLEGNVEFSGTIQELKNAAQNAPNLESAVVKILQESKKNA